MSENYDKYERDNSRQRRPITNTIGFERYGLLEDTYYEAPKDFPSDAKRYLEGLSRCGTLSGAAKIAGISVGRVYELRYKIGIDFKEEEDIAKDCMTDVLEESLFRCGLGEVNGSARVKALTAALEAKRPQEYNRAQKHSVEGDIAISWLDLVRQSDKESKDEAN